MDKQAQSVSPTVPTPPAKPLDIVKDPAGNTALQAWIQRALNTADKVQKLSLLGLIHSLVGPLPDSFRVNRGFTSKMALAAPDKAPLAEVVWPSMEHTRGRFVAPKDRGKNTLESSGPFVTDNRAEIIVSIRAGAPTDGKPLDQVKAKVAWLLALTWGLMMVARGEPEADAGTNRIREFGGDYWTVAERVGFSPANRRDKFAPSDALAFRLRDIADQLPDLPVGALAFDIGAQAIGSQSGKRFRIACPYDLRDDAPKVAAKDVGEKIRAREIHFSGLASYVINEASALPYCGEGAHPAFTLGGNKVPASRKPLRIVMLEERGEGAEKETYIFPLGEPAAKVITVGDTPNETDNTAPVVMTGTGGATH